MYCLYRLQFANRFIKMMMMLIEVTCLFLLYSQYYYTITGQGQHFCHKISLHVFDDEVLSYLSWSNVQVACTHTNLNRNFSMFQ